MKSIVMDMRFVFLATLLAMFTQTLTTGTPLWLMGDSFIAMSLVVFASLIAKRYLPSSLPAFAYATIIGILICLPETRYAASLSTPSPRSPSSPAAYRCWPLPGSRWAVSWKS